MANPEHLNWLREGVEAWNTRWEELHAAGGGAADFSGANLRGANLGRLHLREADLRGADFYRANLSKANLSKANLYDANLGWANLREADLRGANLGRVHLREADLRGANLRMANLLGAILFMTDCSGANLGGADLRHAAFVRTNLRGADLTGCRVYGISAWDVQVDERTKQASLVITPGRRAEVSVDNLKVAQFVYLLLTNPDIRDVIDTVGRKAVLILGRFTDERKAILVALRDALRQRDYVPILFDFEKPASRDLTETVSTLAHLARFVIADLTDAKSLPQELQAIVPDLPSVPVQPLILEGQHEYAMFEHFTRYPWVLPLYAYADQNTLLEGLTAHVITPAEAKAEELTPPQRVAG